MAHPITEKWNDKQFWFRDDQQAYRVGTIIIERLADDRVQEECRYLCRLRWHFLMSYQDVSYDELEQYVSPDKMAVLKDLFSSIAAFDYEGIDSWITDRERTLSIIVDRWLEQNAGYAE